MPRVFDAGGLRSFSRRRPAPNRASLPVRAECGRHSRVNPSGPMLRAPYPNPVSASRNDRVLVQSIWPVEPRAWEGIRSGGISTSWPPVPTSSGCALRTGRRRGKSWCFVCFVIVRALLRESGRRLPPITRSLRMKPRATARLPDPHLQWSCTDRDALLLPQKIERSREHQIGAPRAPASPAIAHERRRPIAIAPPDRRHPVVLFERTTRFPD